MIRLNAESGYVSFPAIADIRIGDLCESESHHTMDPMRRIQAQFVGVGLLALLACAFLIWKIAGLPLQPAHVVAARVIAIASVSSGAGRPPRTYIVIRNAHGTGQFVLSAPEVRCAVGQDVNVQQRGITLTPLPTTCR